MYRRGNLGHKAHPYFNHEKTTWMADFLLAHAVTKANEGVYSNDKRDSGGETYMGISRNRHPMWEGWRYVDACKGSTTFPSCLSKNTKLKQMVLDFYRFNFWNKVWGDRIEDQQVATQLYDTAVNKGYVSAIRTSQVAAGMPITGKMNETLLTYLNSLV